jgi:hypothetical protein
MLVMLAHKKRFKYFVIYLYLLAYFNIITPHMQHNKPTLFPLLTTTLKKAKGDPNMWEECHVVKTTLFLLLRNCWNKYFDLLYSKEHG